MKRTRTVLTIASLVAFGLLAIIWPVSYHLNLFKSMGTGKPAPSDSIPVAPGYHLGFQDGGVWLYNYEMPYTGGIIALVTTNDPPPVRWFWNLGDYGFGHTITFTRLGKVSERSCDFPGIYFRDIWHEGHDPAYITLMMSLWYPILLSAVLPTIWLFRRSRLLLRKP